MKRVGLKEVFRRIFEANLDIDKFTRKFGSGPAKEPSDPMGSKKRDVSKIGRKAASRSVSPVASKKFSSWQDFYNSEPEAARFWEDELDGITSGHSHGDKENWEYEREVDGSIVATNDYYADEGYYRWDVDDKTWELEEWS